MNISNNEKYFQVDIIFLGRVIPISFELYWSVFQLYQKVWLNILF